MEYDDVKLRKLFSDLLKLTEEFLCQEIYEANTLNKAAFLIKAIEKKGIEQLHNSSINTAKRLIRQQSTKNANHFYYISQIEKNIYELKEYASKKSDKKNINDIVENLDLFYIADKLKYYCYVLSQKYILSIDEYDQNFIEEIISHVKEKKYKNIPPIAIYYQISLTLIEPNDESHYFKLKDLVEKYTLQFPRREAYDIYDYAINYCIRKINTGYSHFLNEYFELYVDFLEREIVFINGKLTPIHFRTVIVAALRLKKYEWVDAFIKNYQDRLPEASKENAVTFNTARLHFYQKNYVKVIELLREVEYEDVTYNLTSKAMLLITYYDLDEIEPLYSLMESFRVFLNRHKEIPPQRRKNYLNLIKFTKKLTKIIAGDKKAIDKIKTEIGSTPALVNKNWLKEKIAELE